MRKALFTSLCLAVASPTMAMPVQPQEPPRGETPPSPATLRDRLPQDEVIYFVLPDRFANADPRNDRGGLTGDRLKTGYDPTHKGFFQGGDLKGLTEKLDYIQGMGVTAIWFAPVFKNKPVQGSPGQESAGYHGYWVTDFTRVDPHFGTNAEFKAFVDAAHARGMKVYMDIITNHTADVIFFRECVDQPACPYRSKGDYPYSRHQAINGKPINTGFAGDEVQTAENFAKLTDPSYAYTPVVPHAEAGVKVPAWLNDPIHYHNRGNTTFEGESSRFGDFVGLDDIFTEHQRVVDGFIQVYGDWIDRFGIDGFRIDTARHVNPGFWQRFVPAMLDRAKARGIPNFHIFGEIYADRVDPGYTAQFTRRDGFPATLDFAFQAAVRAFVTGTSGPEVMERLFTGDVLYAGGDEGALGLPTFLGNHDMGRLGGMLQRDLPNASAEELFARLKLAHVLLFGARGVPTIYYGDEQGFTGDGHDQDARETMFPTRVASYADNRLLGTARASTAAHFDAAHPLYRLIADLSAIRRSNPALRNGQTVLRAFEKAPGIVAFSRILPGEPEIVVAANNSDQTVTQNIAVSSDSAAFAKLLGDCPATASAPGTLTLTLPPFGFAMCRAVHTNR